MRKLFISIAILFVFVKSNSQVSLQTGAAEFSYPIFSHTDNNRLSASVSIDYLNGNGLKVSEIASCVGTGWRLNAGGMITREQRGLPDDQRRSFNLWNPLPYNTVCVDLDYHTKYFPNGYIFSAYHPDDVITNEAAQVRTGFYNNGPNPLPIRWVPEKEVFAADRQQDIFRIEYGKGAVEFVIGKDRNAEILNDSKVKIEIIYDLTDNLLNQNIRTCITQFIVTDIDGLKYYFSLAELSTNCRYKNISAEEVNIVNGNLAYSGGPNQVQLFYLWAPPNNTPQPNSNRTPAFIADKTPSKTVTKWYLTYIENPMTGEKIEFTYENYNIDMFTCRSLHFDEATSTLINREILSTYQIKRIQWNDNYKVDFEYLSTPRIDVPGIKPLQKILLSVGNSTLLQYEFSYQYFFTSAIKPYDHHFEDYEKFLTRLSLKSIEKKGIGVNERPLLFEYYLGDEANANNYSTYSLSENGIYFGNRNIVPPMYSLTTDHWGYFNWGGQSNRNGNYLDWQSPINKIPYSGTPYYECMNVAQAKIPVLGMAKNGILKRITYPAGGYLEYEFEQNNAYYREDNKSVGGVRVMRTTLFDGVNQSNNVVKQYKYIRDNSIDKSSGWGYEPLTYAIVKNRRVYAQSRGNQPTSMIKDFATGIVTETIKQSVQFPSVGLQGNFSNAVQNGLLGLVIQIIISQFDQNQQEINDYTGTERRNFAFELSNPLPNIYSRVEISDYSSLGNTNGKTVYEFTSPDDLPLLVGTLAIPFSPQPRLNKSYYGLVKTVTIYDNENFKLNETINSYELISHESSNLSKLFTSSKYIYDKFPSIHTTYMNQVGNITENVYREIREHTRLRSVTKKVWSKNSPSVFSESITKFEYNQRNNEIMRVIEFDSKGTKITHNTYYPFDYNLSLPQHLILKRMNNQNIMNAVISTETWIEKPQDIKRLVDLKVNVYDMVNGTNDFRPIKTYQLETQAPIPVTVIGDFDGDNLIRSPNAIIASYEFKYDEKCRLIESIDLKGKKTASTIFEQSYNYPLVSITNARSEQVAFTSFEDLRPLGEWIVDYGDIAGSAQIEEGLCPTGKKYLSLRALGSTSITTSVQAIDEDYTLSFWATTNTYTLNAGQLRFSGPTINGWTYYEYDFPIGSSAPFISGESKLDELRFYPKKANLVSTTYLVGVGKTSECDINNRIQYFEYDGLRRIRMIRDESRNIIKTYEYQYKN